jgi:energy-coupling factor transporter ATP-binding protein EcfA2
VIRRLYVHNFRCLENFELPALSQASILLIGKNGSGKTTVGVALEILQKIGRGTSRVDALVRPKDMSRGRTDVPVRFEVEVEIGQKIYAYSIAFDLPGGFKELRVAEEKLSVDGNPVYTREQAQVSLARSGDGMDREAKFRIDWHLVALPIIQEQSPADPLSIFKTWLARMLILRPVPGHIVGDSSAETLQPAADLADFGAWFAGLMSYAPAAYATVDRFLRAVLPDLRDIKNPLTGKEYRNLVVQFSNEQGSLTLPFEDLSDGEKCFMICSLVLAANSHYGPVLCFWDEPDNYLSLAEVGHLIVSLRKEFQSGGQFIATSHNPEAIRRFSNENTLYLYRRSHLEPTNVRRVSELEINGSLVQALVTGDLEP